jgi:hypothetical protein
LLWTEPDWLESVHDWIRSQLERLGLGPAGEIEQPHVRPWSTVLRVPTDDGDVWFKANMPTQAFEVAVVETLAARRPDLVPTLLATDLERGWMLQGDGGTRLREILEETGDFGVWVEILPLYAELQMDVAADRVRLLAAGVPDRLLASLPGQFEEVLTDAEALEALTQDERRRLAALAPRIEAECRQLADYGLPETIQHDDLHDGQVFVRDGHYLFFDWADACVSHPFFSMSVTLEGQLAWGLDDVEGSEDIAPYRDAYLESFRGFAAPPELQAAHEIALRLGWICRALNWDRFASHLPAPYREEYLQGVGLRLRMMLTGFD